MAARQISDTDPDATDIYLAAVMPDTFWDRSVLDSAALHPSTAERLVRTGTSTQRTAMALLASRSDLTEGERAAIDYLIDERDRLDPLHWVYEVTDTDRLRELAGSGNVLIRRSLADNRHLPQDVVDLLSADDDFAVRILLCENQPTVSPDPGLPVEIMHALLDRAGVPRLPAS